MKFIIFLITILISHKTFSADLEVSLKAVRNAKGQLRIAVFNDPKEFPRGDEISSLNIKAKSGDVTALIKGMKPGKYAIAIHHDENSNKQMDTNFIGLPKEGYGFSNDARVFLGPPNFSAASFVIGDVFKKINIHIIY